MPKSEVSADAALFLSVFFDELVRYGVREVVVSPGSRSTPLAMVAFEASRRADLGLRLFIDVDERGAAFFALGMAKASGRPVCLICTSGTAAANYYPAVLEAEASRVPLVVLTGDRPPRLQGLGAPQTCDQLKLYGDHARFFQQMPLPTSDPAALAFARQVARQALISACGPSTCEAAAGSAAYAAAGACGTGSPAHINFPFDDPLKPDLSIPELFTPARSQVDCAPARDHTPARPHLHAPQRLDAAQVAQVRALLHQQRAIVLCGEGSCADAAQRHALLTWAHAAHLPLLADPLSGLRTCDDPLVIDNYDNIFAQPDCPPVDLFIRFGRYPVSKRATTFLARTRPIQIVVDPVQTRDFNAATDLFIQMTPTDFVASLLASPPPRRPPRPIPNRPPTPKAGFLPTMPSMSASNRSRRSPAVLKAPSCTRCWIAWCPAHFCFRPAACPSARSTRFMPSAQSRCACCATAASTASMARFPPPLVRPSTSRAQHFLRVI
ncbi:MAG: 2-succinyl-5-enolpyruvyl-6-hydroxy-3-cyclohexene-1-carboxylic-acid synthase [Raoultibacter sp.]